MLKKITSHKLVAMLCVAAMAFVIGGLSWFVAVFNGVASPLILHFNNAVGVTQIGGFSAVLGIGCLATLMVFLNSVIAMELAGRNRFLGLFTASVNLTLAVLLFVAAAAIISVN